jgi:4-hydroxybutyrate CoA-transferase
MSMGVSVDCSLAAVQTAKNVICQVNKHMPRTHGDGMIHVSQVSALLYV